jgi:hypothetical protein
MWELQQLAEPPLAILDRSAPDILTVHLEKVESAESGAAVATVIAHEIEYG